MNQSPGVDQESYSLNLIYANCISMPEQVEPRLPQEHELGPA